ncbi:HDIG domain-containing metalloprotein [Rubritalea spongiae]|uniref:HDIG domain-containing metalloprotein n=1 Tax=Rubritalea spongiae TaxID=430797 RepID=A0ABW5DYT3_9BACT
MSSGKKRRTQGERTAVATMDRSVFFRVLLYLLFLGVSSVLVFSATTGGESVLTLLNAVFVNILMGAGLVALFDMRHQHRVRNGRVILVFGTITVHLVILYFVAAIVPSMGSIAYVPLLLPYALAPLVNSVLLGRLSGMYTTYVVTMLGSLLIPAPITMQYMVLSLITGITVVAFTKKVRRRGALLRAGFYAGVVVMVLGVLFEFIQWPENAIGIQTMGKQMLGSLGVSLLIAMVVSGILPALESMFGLTTDISWLEMSDLNHKLLRQMQLEAPGTFHHSLIVASLAEAAAEEVGANATMCRVCAYFHDIGKLKKPTYFIENQGEENPHDNLTPSMSALVIIAHVKDGVDLAIKHKLDPMIIDVIREHHGDSLVYYFYHKARETCNEAKEKAEQGLINAEDVPDVDEKNFRYAGPRPRTPESGIISLADCVESASRTLTKPSPAKIEALVNDIVSKRIAEGQMDDCGLTLSDLKKIRKSFAKTIRSILHSRINYPKEEEKKNDEELRAAGRPSSLQRKVEEPLEKRKSGQQTVKPSSRKSQKIKTKSQETTPVKTPTSPQPTKSDSSAKSA